MGGGRRPADSWLGLRCHTFHNLFGDSAKKNKTKKTPKNGTLLKVWKGPPALVVHADVAEQVGHGLPVVDAADGLRQDHADVHRFDLGTLQLLVLVGDGVGHHHLRGAGGERNGKGEGHQSRSNSGGNQGKVWGGGTHLVDGRLLDEARGLTGEEAVCCHDVDLVGSSLLQGLGCCHETVHVVDDVILRRRNEKCMSGRTFHHRQEKKNKD